MSENLEDLRRQIDEQNAVLLDAFEKRMEISMRIAQYKKENDLPVYAPDRERALLKKMTEQARDGMQSYVRTFFLDLMQLSKSAQFRANVEDAYTPLLRKALERSPKMLESGQMVACQGVEGAYSQQAVETMFSFPNPLYFSTFEGVFRAIDSGLCRYGVLPIENSTAGSVGAV
ncbi:MAG: chorismate mutase, partial [Oscillospiraceae bacterium]|nr:chorismate mutase [Oscillospiraceae bacterium]